MKEDAALSQDAIDLIDSLDDRGMGARTEHFSGAELAGLVRSAASYALARAVESDGDGMVHTSDLEKALCEVRPALGTQDDILKLRYPYGISEYSSSAKRVLRDLDRFTAPVISKSPKLNSLLLVGGGPGGGSTALATKAAVGASVSGNSDYTRLITALDILTAEGSGGDEARASALVERFSEAREMQHSLIVLDDIDQICGGSGGSYSTVMVSTLRALLRTPPADSNIAKAGGHKTQSNRKKSFHVIATTSRPDAACSVLNDVFEETIVVPLISDAISVQTLLSDSLDNIANVEAMSNMIIEMLGEVGCKTAIRLVERAIFDARVQEDDLHSPEEVKLAQLAALKDILNDFAGDKAMALRVCSI